MNVKVSELATEGSFSGLTDIVALGALTLRTLGGTIRVVALVQAASQRRELANFFQHHLISSFPLRRSASYDLERGRSDSVSLMARPLSRNVLICQHALLKALMGDQRHGASPLSPFYRLHIFAMLQERPKRLGLFLSATVSPPRSHEL